MFSECVFVCLCVCIRVSVCVYSCVCVCVCVVFVFVGFVSSPFYVLRPMMPVYLENYASNRAKKKCTINKIPLFPQSLLREDMNG